MLRVFVDSDVVISSLISSQGAAYLLLNQTILKLVISDISLAEIKQVLKRMNIDENALKSLLPKLEIIKVSKSLIQIKKEYSNLTYDLDDAHILAAAVQAKANFIISYNQKDFNSNQIKMDFDIILITPGHFLQYLRSI